MKYPRLFVGPMSKEIVDIVIEYSLEKNVLGLIPSRRQIENTFRISEIYETRKK